MAVPTTNVSSRPSTMGELPMDGALDAPKCVCSDPGLIKDRVCLRCGGFRVEYDKVTAGDPD